VGKIQCICIVKQEAHIVTIVFQGVNQRSNLTVRKLVDKENILEITYSVFFFNISVYMGRSELIINSTYKKYKAEVITVLNYIIKHYGMKAYRGVVV
jgi:hypothetical protein